MEKEILDKNNYTHNIEIVKIMKKRVITIQKGVVVSDPKVGDKNEY